MTVFIEIEPRDLLMLRWLREQKNLMSKDEQALFVFLLTQQFLNEFQSDELKKMYDRIREETLKPIDFPKGIYQIEIHESCGMVG